MRETKIIMQAESVRGILEGRKTQTRRIIDRLRKPGKVTEFSTSTTPGYDWHFRDKQMHWHDIDHERLLEMCPYGRPGDRLWTREKWAESDRPDGTPVVAYAAGGCIAVGRDGSFGPDVLIRNFAWNENPYVDRWRPSIHMPRWASRIDLELVSVRVERLQSISDEDVLAEGIYPTTTGLYPGSPRASYRSMWDQINGPGSWDANSWVWRLEFRRIKCQ